MAQWAQSLVQPFLVDWRLVLFGKREVVTNVIHAALRQGVSPDNCLVVAVVAQSRRPALTLERTFAPLGL